jgi:hypothetical protein
MSEQENTPNPQQPTPPGIVEHWCEHDGCAKWGSFGYATGRAEPRWYCGDHRSFGEQA